MESDERKNVGNYLMDGGVRGRTFLRRDTHPYEILRIYDNKGSYAIPVAADIRFEGGRHIQIGLSEIIEDKELLD